MGTLMIYNSVATKEVKPDIVSLTIKMNAKCQTAKEASDKINEDRNIAKTYITAKKSYKPDSYHQIDFNLRKRTYSEPYYVHNDKPSQEISQTEYDNLTQNKRIMYTRKIREKFLYYEANLTLTVVLNYGDTVVEDLMTIFNMCTEKDFKCDYTHSISDELKNTTMQELYTKCINQGVSSVQTIVNGLNFKNDSVVILREVRDPAAKSVSTDYVGFGMKEAALCADNFGSSEYEPEQIITPELLEELFNNNIELRKSLDLTLEF